MAISLKAARINADLSRKQVCEKLDIHENTLASYELYKTKPDIDTAQKLCSLYGCKSDDIKWTKE